MIKQNNVLLKYMLQILLMALVYFLAGTISFLVSPENSLVTIVIFASEGFALAGVLLYGKKLSIGIFLGQISLAMCMNLSLFPSLLIALINASEAILAWYLFKYFKFNRSLSTLKDISSLFLIITLALQPFNAILGTSVLFYFHIIESSDYAITLSSWWFGNVMGQLLFAPLFLSLYSKYKEIHILEFILIALFFFMISYLAIISFELPYLSLLLMITIPLLSYLSSQKPLYYALFPLIIIAMVSSYSTRLHLGLFSSADILNNLISFHFYLLSHILLVLIIATLFNEKDEALAKLQAMAFYDNLTGLPNRYLLDQSIQKALIYKENSQKQSAICFIDVDGFKAINDKLGHHIGDKSLQIIAKRIRNIITKDDTLLRVGGDEFVLILKHQHIKKIKETLQKISQCINRPLEIDEQNVLLSLSIGIALSPLDTNSISSLVHYADKAMYEAKNKGKNGFVFYYQMP